MAGLCESGNEPPDSLKAVTFCDATARIQSFILTIKAMAFEPYRSRKNIQGFHSILSFVLILDWNMAGQPGLHVLKEEGSV
ncbi:hypothetical protein ANN_15072 [Periplaneta americana]|uniref:Uncharacterized protein n=1 Tax=Periplaneta americana TaxID=6978 RepID=A0ABQ8SZK5_PERAM|nr:hypothetical protein ANN_15072 [Periplaneta americana]